MPKGSGPPKRSNRGRPPLPEAAGKRHSLGIRTTKILKDRLIEATAISGRSLAQEIELRLEASMTADEALGGPKTAAFLRMLAAAGRSMTGVADWAAEPESMMLMLNKIKILAGPFIPPISENISQKIENGWKAKSIIESKQNIAPAAYFMAAIEIYKLANDLELPDNYRQEFKAILTQHAPQLLNNMVNP